MQDENRLRVEMTDICKKLYANGLIAATDGNVSCRVGSERILVTPASVAKNELKPVDLLAVDFHGKVIAGKGMPSSEIRMHLEVFRNREDIRAVVHAHPPLLTAITVAGLPFVADMLPEVWLSVGSVATAPYATPSTVEVPESIRPYVGKHNALLLERHGSLTFGKDLMEAYLRLEKLEHAAKIQIYAHLMNMKIPRPLPEDAIEKLTRIKR